MRGSNWYSWYTITADPQQRAKEIKKKGGEEGGEQDRRKKEEERINPD